MTIRARKSDYCEDWHVEQEIPCINGLSAWFVIATAEEADEASMGYTDGIFGTAEDRARRIVDALEHTARITIDSVAPRLQLAQSRGVEQKLKKPMTKPTPPPEPDPAQPPPPPQIKSHLRRFEK